MGTRHVQNKSRDEKLRVAVKATAVILPLLGITWLFGLLAFSAETVAFKYIFAILNSLQGLMIFIFHCVLNKQIQDAVKRRYQQLSSSDSSIGNTKSRSQDKTVKIDSRPLGPKTKTKNEYEMAPTDSSTTLPNSNKVQSPTGASTVSNDDVCVHLSQDDFQYPDEGSNGCSTYNEIQDPTYENSKIQESDESRLDERLLKRDAGYINPLMLNDNDSTDDVYIGSSGMSDRAQESDSDTDLVYRIAVSGETDSEPEGEWSRRTSTISIESNDSMGVFYEYSLIDVKENEENEGKAVVFLGSKTLEWNA